jgi:hypothetical protein
MLIFRASYGSTIDLHGDGELEGFEFLQPPIEYRFLREGTPISDWAQPEIGYVSLLRPVILGIEVQTRGLDARHLAIETRGLCGTFILLVWPRT